MPLPNLLIIGAQKSGTTWLHRSLAKSPQIFGSQVKELSFFTSARYRLEPEKYELNFPETRGARYYMESTPHYFRLPKGQVDVPARIKAFLPETPQMILMLRQPADRYESAYIHHVMKGRQPFVETITEMKEDFAMLKLGFYARILKHWQQYFTDYHIHLYDELKADKHKLVDDIMGELGLVNDIRPADLEFRTNAKTIKMRKQGMEKLPVMDPELRVRLTAHYRDDILELQDLIDRDLSHWLADPA